MHDYSLFTMFRQGWPVLSVLLLMSIFSTAVLVDRWRAFRLTHCDALHFVRHVIRIADERGCDIARAYCVKYSLPVARAALAVFDARANRDVAMTHAIELEVHKLETGVAALGTIASLAPFVGLFGTVVGIIKAFGSIAVNSGGTEVVSAGIAEALIATAMGIAAAIPAVLAYNYFLRKLKLCEAELDYFATDFLNLAVRSSLKTNEDK